MSYFEGLFPKDLYHTYIVEGDPKVTSGTLRDFLQAKLSAQDKTVDFLTEYHDSLAISDCHIIKEWHSHKNIEGHIKIAIISAKFLNHEAQRALLKIFEEPAEGSHFFLVVPDSSALLDTILSRAHVIKKENKINKELQDKADKFLTLSLKEKLDVIAEMIEKNKDNEGSGGLRYEAMEFINQIESNLFNKAKSKDKYAEYSLIFAEIHKCRTYLSTPGAGVKMILEHIALML